MVRKIKFKPVITKIKLNPEQAVLQCDCFNGAWRVGTDSYRGVPGLIATYCRTLGRALEVDYNPCNNFSGMGGKYTAQLSSASS
jgi:hypothetical protein